MSKKQLNHFQGSIEFPNQKIEDRNMEKEVKTSFIEYSMSVITSRALPDVRDGLKPGQRRILYAMYEDGLTYEKPFRKSATTVGNVLGRYHPHGDVAVYDTMVRMAQPFSLRYPLIEGHGNFGNVDGDGAAAYRYTEARMAKMANYMLSDIEKETVEFIPNFDNSRKEPTVLTSRFPNLLVNGSVGIAVGMATNIPTHNLGEVVDGIIYRMDNPECSVLELMQYIKGPDFPTYATIYGTMGIYNAYSTGRGRVYVRAKAHIDDENKQIIFTEIPFQVRKSQLVESMGKLVNDKKIDGITGLRDESGRAGMRIVVDYRRDANPEVILNQLYKYSQLQDTCAINMIALVNGEPKLLTLPQILDNYISFQNGVIRKRTEYDLKKALHEMHIYEGYKIAIDHIDEIIEIVKKSESIPDAKEKLMERFGLSDYQAQAIVEMTIGRLSGLERQKIENRLEKLSALVDELQGILADDNKILQIIKDDLSEIKRLYADERRTELVEVAEEIEDEDLIPRQTCVLTFTKDGYIKRLPASTYSAQRRGGKGVIGMTTKEEDFIDNVIVANSHSYLLMFTNMGKVHTKKVYRIPEASRTSKGTNIVNIIELQENEKVTALITVDDFTENEYLTMVTKNGIMKRTLLSDFEYQRRGGKIAITLDENDELLFVKHTKGGEDILVASRDGLAVRFTEENVRCMGRLARGVRGIKLKGDDYVVGLCMIDDEKYLLTLTEGGFGKRTPFEDFRQMKNRGGSGVACHKISEKTGKLASVATVDESDDIMIITNEGVIIRTPVEGIPVYSRTAGGVITMRLDEGCSIVNFARVEKEEEIEALAEQEEIKVQNMPAVDSSERGSFDDGDSEDTEE
ncbi:MAG: DNA gyrase subunit A [Ruminococcaceae bacterium]|nr:DNA gyrase subunit A [Oscillospiraceae bacterium]